MLLYHGTAAENVVGILKDGIRPRGRRQGNWQHTIRSNPSCVYLTSAYAGYFALCASESGRIGILEVNTDRLDQNNLLPDEDFLEQANRSYDGNKHGRTMKMRTEWYRKHARQYQPHWKLSVEKMGTCCYKGMVSPSAITRATTFDGEGRADILMAVADPTITILNYRFCGTRYRAITRWLVGYDIDVEKEILDDGYQALHWFPDYQKQLQATFGNKTGLTILRGG